MAWEDRAYNREPEFGRRAGGFGVLVPPTRLALVLMVINLVVFLAQAATAPIAGASPLIVWGELTFREGLAFTQPWRWITYQYLHGGGMHIFFNLVTMYFFIPFLERKWGWKKTFAFYSAGGIAGGVAFGIMAAILGAARAGSLIGASGSLLAVIGAIAAIAPDMQVLLIVIPMTMRTLAILYSVLYTLTILGDRSLSDAAHLGGLAFGVGAVWLAGPTFRRAIERWEERRSQASVQAERAEEQTIDAILKKVHDHGMNSLSRSERKALARATERQRQAELAKAARRA